MGTFRIALLLAAGSLIASGVVANGSQEQSKFDLAPGYYIFLGTQPGRVPPKAFTINSAGTVFWQDNTAASADDKLPGLDPLPLARPNGKSSKQSSSQPVSDQFEAINYPIIKWRPKPVSSMPGAFVQLSTTYEQNVLKYKLTLFKSKSLQAGQKPNIATSQPGVKEISASAIPTFAIDVQLLDTNGFKLVQFTVQSNQWDLIPGTNVLEARDQLNCNEWDYKRSRDYAVK